MAALEERLAEAVRQFPVLYGNSCRDFKNNSKKRLVWDDVPKQVGLQTGMYSSSEYSFICLMFSFNSQDHAVVWVQFSRVFPFEYQLPWCCVFFLVWE